MKQLAGERGEFDSTTFDKHSWFWNDLEKRAEHIFRQSNKAAIAFNAMDIDDDGFVTKTEFGKVITGISESKIKGIFEKYDESFDGRLTSSEFKNFMGRRKFMNKSKN